MRSEKEIRNFLFACNKALDKPRSPCPLTGYLGGCNNDDCALPSGIRWVLEDSAEKNLHAKLQAFFIAECESLKIDRLCEWLNNIAKKILCQ